MQQVKNTYTYAEMKHESTYIDKYIHMYIYMYIYIYIYIYIFGDMDLHKEVDIGNILFV